MNDALKLGLKLLAITAVAALALGLTNMATKDPILNQRAQAELENMMDVLPGAQEFENIDIKKDSISNEKATIQEINEGKDSNANLMGYAFKLTTKGFGGEVEVIVGIDKNGIVQGIRIGNHGETPGLGAKAIEPAFQDQFKGKSSDSAIDVIKASPKDNEIQAITGATITSKAVTSAVNLSSEYFTNELKDGGGQK